MSPVNNSDGYLIKNSPLLRSRIGLLFVLFLSFPLAESNFVVVEGASIIERNRLHTGAELDLALDKTPAEALLAGIPLNVTIDVQIYKIRNPFWKTRIAEWQYHHIVDYHHLSGRYSVEDVNLNQMQTFATLIEAMNSLSKFNVSEKIPFLVNKSDRLQARIRARLDKNELPAPLRLITLFFKHWQQTADWRQWNIVH